MTDGSAVVRAGLASGETVILAVSTNTFAFKLIGGPDVRRPEDLRGRKLGITRAGTTTDFAARYMLRQWGLAPDADVSLIQTGGNPEMLAALYAGAIDAAIMSDPNSFQAVKDGYAELLDIGAQGIEYPMFSVATHRALLRERPAALRAFVTAYIDAIAWLERHRPETLAMMARYTQQDDRRCWARHTTSIRRATSCGCPIQPPAGSRRSSTPYGTASPARRRPPRWAWSTIGSYASSTRAATFGGCTR